MKQIMTDLRDKAWSVIVNTPVEVAIGAALVGALSSAIAYSSEMSKAGQIPLAFSEIGKTELYVEDIGKGKIPPLTKFYSVSNDMVMQIFEANNIATNVWGMSDRSFAYELEKKIDSSMRVHTLFTDYTKEFPTIATEARGSIKKMIDAEKDLIPIITALDNSWDEDHDDVYRTEYYTTTSCDSKGSCTTQTRSRQVYDYTIHTYEFNANWARRAESLISQYKIRHPDVNIYEKLILPDETEAENEWAMRESRKRLKGYTAPTQEQYLAWARMWATGSNYNVFSPEVYKNHAKLISSGPEFSRSIRLAKSRYRYTTGSSTDSGPGPYQSAEKSLAFASNTQKNIAHISGGINVAEYSAKKLEKDMQTYVDVVLRNKPSTEKPSKLKREILKQARDMYQYNFAGGFDVKPVKWMAIVGWTFLGIFLGGLIGFGIDSLIRQYNIPQYRYRY